MEFKHVPIMLDECINNLNINPDGVYVDATLGGAGHSSEIAKRLSSKGTLIGIDKDATAIKVSGERLAKYNCNVILVNDDYKNLLNILKDNNIEKIDGLLADLGVSSYQLDEVERGFSYSKDAPLDMRMNQNQSLTAKEVVNNYSEKELLKILYEYGEENFAKSIVRNILKAREEKPITTTGELVKIIEKSFPAKLLHKGGSVCKKTFQAIRIEVNSELENLKSVLNDMIECLKPKGRLCIITFHSLEDRLVKNCFTENSTGCICPKSFPICVCNHKPIVKLINKKPIVPSENEQKVNSRSTSSKLRVAEKI
ncbi:MAG: 16S rRNA (cytosine(1402)-N(4))-methyltransferase RsmH [Clostridia bacterium]|nr:16S rRNA (cytosine(1402)-N(4))-methyltransferase RsmH [Clostridia bacterium]